MKATYDIAIVGLGAVGSAALYHAARAGLSAVGFDRHSPPHTEGSSHGGSRIIRRAYFEGAMYVPLLSRAYALWRELEDASGRELAHMNGCLTIGPDGGAALVGARDSADAHDIPYEHLLPEDVRRRFPAFHLRPGEAALYEPDAGWLDPEACIATHLDLAARASADLRLEEPVRTWGMAGSDVRLETDAGTFDVARLVLSAGGWLGRLLSEIHVPLRVERQVNAWFRPDGADERFRPDRCPVYIWEYEPDRVLYGFPDLGGEGVKTGLHYSGQFVDDPEDLDRIVHENDVRALQGWTEKLLPGACRSVARTATCFYTDTPDRHYLIDWHPGLDNVVFASACSGHGFKASSAVGESLVRMAMGEEPAVDLSPFRLNRFRKDDPPDVLRK